MAVGVVLSAASPSTEMIWRPASRIAAVRYTQGTNLNVVDGAFLVDSLTGWIGESAEPFAVLADAAGLHGTDAAYRAKASAFFREHKDEAFIALINLGPVIHIVVEMFRIGTGIQLKTFTDEAAAHAWLRTKGIKA